MDGTHAYQEGGHLVFGELGENLGKHFSPVGRHIPEDLEARLGSVNAHNSAILGAVASLYQPALLHAIDDPGRAGVGNVHRLGQALHRERPFGLEGCQDVEMDETEGVPVPGLEHPATVLWRPARHLLEQLSLERLAAGIVDSLTRVSTPGRRYIQHDIEYSTTCKTSPDGPISGRS